MGIAQKVARYFSDAVRVRGQSYFVKGRVSLMAARASEVVARVRGTAKYRVRVRLRGSKLLASCTCPYFNPQGEPCKHLWATLLLAEARSLLQSPPVFPVHLVTESPRRSPPAGLVDVRPESGQGLDEDGSTPREGDVGFRTGIVGLGPTRARRRATINSGGKIGGLDVTCQANQGFGGIKAMGSTTVPAWAVVPRARRRAPAHRERRPLIVMPRGCWFMSSMWVQPWRRTKWSSTWRDASAKRPVSGGRFGPGTTHLTLPMSNTIPRTA